MADARSFTNAEKYEAAKREVKMRRRVYPQWTQRGKMSEEESEWQIAVMESIMLDYQRADIADRTILI